MSIVVDLVGDSDHPSRMATTFEDIDVQGNLSTNNATIRGNLSVGGKPVEVGVTVSDEGTALANNPHAALNFVGTGVAVTDVAGVATVAIAGGVTVSDEGTALANNPHAALNFVGAGVAVTDVAGVATVAIAGGVTVSDEGTALANNPHAALNFVGAGVAVTDVAGVATVAVSGAVAVLIWGAADLGAGADTRFLSPGFSATASTTNILQIPIPFDATLRSFFVRHNASNGDGDSVVYTVLVNGVATQITATLITGAIGQASDVAHSVEVRAGDTVSIAAIKPLDITDGAVSVTVTLEVE
jgi:hypothetical protein